MKARSLILAIVPLLALSAACSGGDGGTYSRAETASGDAAAPAAEAPAAGPQMPSGADVAASPEEGNAPADPASGAQPGAQAATPMIIRNGTATIRVDSLEPAIARLQQMARQLGGYVGNTSIATGSEQTRTARVEMKIPSARFDQALSGIRPLGTLEKVETTSQDVGEEYVDVTARMTNARRMETRLLELLANRTGRLEDVLAVERELARVREEIERYEGRLRFLRTRVATSTLTVELHEPYPIASDYPGQNPILRAFRQAWRNFVNFLALLIASLGILVPLALIAAALIWLLLKLLRRLGVGSRPHTPPPYGPPPAGPPPSGPATSGPATSGPPPAAPPPSPGPPSDRP